MTNWQQVAYREDPYSDIPFAGPHKFNPEIMVGLVCLFAALVAACL